MPLIEKHDELQSIDHAPEKLERGAQGNIARQVARRNDVCCARSHIQC